MRVILRWVFHLMNGHWPLGLGRSDNYIFVRLLVDFNIPRDQCCVG